MCVSEGNWRMKGGLGGAGGGDGGLQVSPKLFNSQPARLSRLLKARQLWGFLETHSRRVRKEEEEEGGGGPGLIATN